ncbi:Sphingolipid C4-hydroxylase sur2 [Emydomyces testavorans]|uniref:Sphingolipid C4-hydroxylase sur2 n=1 Tax=Emydomyces testavorans TaxID=2070801 RepID=A0AAF0IE13_9EURO|nr:Sphingolipid C4-hydroxylase sur2 [Emydomyces testavorans]
MSNSTAAVGLPPLPAYTLTPREPLVPPIPDNIIILIFPVVAYWVVSLAFHWIDVRDFFPQYRLHTPEELLKRNHVSQWEVVRDVIVQQIIQTVVGLFIAYIDGPEYTGKEDYEVAVWAQRIRVAQRVIPQFLVLLGVDPAGLAEKLSSYPNIAAVISGGQYPLLTQTIISETGKAIVAPAFAQWELFAAGAVYWYLVPVLQFLFAICFVDTWQYFLHRAMHMNKWLYTTFHSRHHRLYVPYAFGALYNHPVEGFLLDTLGTGLAFMASGMTCRQGMWFFTCSTIKTIDDHCGYAFPFDPLQHITSNNAAYHDIHHQSWGIKTNFSQPFFTFWDRFLNTKWSGGDVTLRYERSRLAAHRMMEEDKVKEDIAKAESKRFLKDEDETSSRSLLAKSVCKKTTPFSSQAETLKGASHRLSGSIRQK